ncbi:GntR family transcriptional regulator [Sphingomonas nostoxanthinifaciens]|uniref:GntR family transcriptional regulator n=1 Tax=Sphingomonas nostoxanthinifaciens TaxID=2872652 RepID=UPI001CC20E6D|nr:GntR family transcriptional regulator [Sphingomonas nostoxanthinifaciens]UAK24770.1 GntR family transcriptional regulator [Sphingomonas nostoxanthinifaciens]
MEQAGAIVEEHAAEAMPSTLRTHLVRTLRQQIMGGRFRPGERLNESQIAREFNISRIPVREALSQLQEQGLVMNHERRGMFVVQLAADEVQQINSLRMVLEPEAMRLARARMTAPVRAELTRLVEQMEAWDGPLIEAAALDRTFHAVIWRAAGNPYLERTLTQLTTSLFAHKALEHVSQEIRRWRLNHHRELLDYVLGGDADPQLAMLTHLRMGYTEPERFSSLAVRGAPAA